MKKIVFPPIKWHVLIILLITLVLSIISWFFFAKTIESIVLHGASDKVKEAGTSTEENIALPDEMNTMFSAEETQQYDILSKPISMLDNGVSFFDSKWSVALKSYFSKVDSLVSYYGLGIISSAQVIQGKEKWLFYVGSGDGEPIKDYEGTNLYTQQELEKAAFSAIWTQEEMSKRGIRLAILVAPNKENIYSEYMPETYIHSEESRTDTLVKFLKAKGVNVIWPKSELLDNHLSSEVYYLYDTHWNQLGAYIGVRNTLLSWNITMPDLSRRRILSKDLKGNYHLCGEDDLAQMAGLRSVLTDETEYEVDGTILMEWEVFRLEQESKQISYFHNVDAQNDASVLLVGDSFRSSMVPSLREQFTDVYVVHRSYYTPGMLDQIQPDYLISEYVERYSDGIANIHSLLIQ